MADTKSKPDEWLNFRHLYAFWSVCRHGGFRKASERIFVSQSTVSEQVALLEDYLGEELLERNTRALTVTDRGADLLTFADDIFAKSEEINRIFRDKAPSSRASNIRIGMVGGISRNFIFGVINRALDKDDGTRINVVDGSFDELNAMLRGFELDLIFSLDQPRQKDLVSTTHQCVESSPMCVAGTPESIGRLRRARKRKTRMEAYMFRHPFEGPPLSELLSARFRLEVDVPVWTDDISLLRFLANGGRGVSIVPEVGVREDLAAGRLASVRLDDAAPVAVYAIFLTNGVRRELVEAFLE